MTPDGGQSINCDKYNYNVSGSSAEPCSSMKCFLCPCNDGTCYFSLWLPVMAESTSCRGKERGIVFVKVETTVMVRRYINDDWF